ncbi:MAG: SDR family oxidoreductase [Candidatus Kariarchaeaceae archaeon]
MSKQDNLHQKQINLKEAKVLITGGTSGLGKALAIALDRMGAKVAIIARNMKKLDEMKNLFPNIITIQGDVSDKSEIYKISGNVLGHLGGIDILVNNASYLGPTPLKLLIDTECEELSEVLETNLLGPFRLTKAVLSSMILQNKGLIVNISSDAAVSPYETWGSYSISKAGLDHMSRIWNEELKNSGVNVISIDPGDMVTPMHFDAIPDANPDELHNPEHVAYDLLKFIDKLYTFPEINSSRFTANEWRMILSN